MSKINFDTQQIHEFGETTREKINTIGGNIFLFIIALGNAGIYIPTAIESIFSNDPTLDAELKLFAFLNMLLAVMSFVYLLRSSIRKFGSDFHKWPLYWLVTIEALIFSLPVTIEILEEVIASIQNAQ